ncbi:PREDICTED: putative F-box protein At3g51171 [Erythranthe guttata]|uniref:putative F-box protein At3g51171 n=1 Tax=Erythranthe guttata TaxID=4155 RepID=UPI00064D8AB5|nr:PREDICTED: putative F-box protein At3g51171 [Erythranthe guttata]|eukprot:XP_012843127.1 PREDICTED: putative F-box protein At3g51171 [Erythranthe guttata]
MADDKSDLPPEIIEIILSKLSVKSLLRFKSVSKSWNTMITDPVFVQNHVKKSTESNSHNLILCRASQTSPIQFSVVKLEDKKFQTLPVAIEAPFSCWMVVVADWDYYSVYSCKNKSWITMKEEYEIEGYGEGLVDSRRAVVCVDGASYWVWNNRKITYYDPRDDKFKMLQKPEKLEDCEQIYLANLRSSLCVYCYFYAADKVQFWTKENGIDSNSWKELMTVQCDKFLYLQPLYFFVENKIVFRVDFKRLVIYSPSEKRFEEFEDDTRLLCIGMVPVPYIESFYFPIEKPKPKRKWKRNRRSTLMSKLFRCLRG